MLSGVRRHALIWSVLCGSHGLAKRDRGCVRQLPPLSDHEYPQESGAGTASRLSLVRDLKSSAQLSGKQYCAALTGFSFSFSAFLCLLNSRHLLPRTGFAWRARGFRWRMGYGLPRPFTCRTERVRMTNSLRSWSICHIGKMMALRLATTRFTRTLRIAVTSAFESTSAASAPARAHRPTGNIQGRSSWTESR